MPAAVERDRAGRRSARGRGQGHDRRDRPLPGHLSVPWWRCRKPAAAACRYIAHFGVPGWPAHASADARAFADVGAGGGRPAKLVQLTRAGWRLRAMPCVNVADPRVGASCSVSWGSGCAMAAARRLDRACDLGRCRPDRAGACSTIAGPPTVSACHRRGRYCGLTRRQARRDLCAGRSRAPATRRSPRSWA